MNIGDRTEKEIHREREIEREKAEICCAMIIQDWWSLIKISCHVASFTSFDIFQGYIDVYHRIKDNSFCRKFGLLNVSIYYQTPNSFYFLHTNFI